MTDIDREKAALWDVYHAVSDYLLGLEHPEFAQEYGGGEDLFLVMKSAHDQFTKEFNTIPEDEL